MIEGISDKRPKARKVHSCDCREFMEEGLGYYKGTGKILFSDLRIIAKIKAENHKILPGTIYVRQVNKYEGDIWTYRARLDSYSLCSKYNLFPDDY